jgi:hypothetical protein
VTDASEEIQTLLNRVSGLCTTTNDSKESESIRVNKRELPVKRNGGIQYGYEP